MNVEDFLVEIGTEELPPKALKKLSNTFATNIRQLLDDAGLAYNEVNFYASPRRLAVLVSALSTSQKDKSVEKRGPAIASAFDKDGKPTKAVMGFAKSCGVEVSDLSKITTDKGSWVSYTLNQKGKQSTQLMPEIVTSALDKLPIPKKMRWSSFDVEFVRPVHWIVLMLGAEIIPANIYGIDSDRKSRGHRFHYNQEVVLNKANEYEAALKSAKVIVDFTKRQELIQKQVEAVAKKTGGTAIMDPLLLEEVTSMVEWPMAIAGDFEEKFLDVPSEALISAMKHHQKYFHLVDKQQKLLPVFITVSNIESSNPGSVKAGNEKVIRPRLADAMFFWETDKKTTLDSRLPSLKNVVFQSKLGTLFDKTNRIKILAAYIAKTLGQNKAEAERAAELCKCDLMTNMVGEFPDLQGTMGRYYANHGNETKEVAIALEEYYQPRFSGDSIPPTEIGQTLALADKIDTIIGIFGIGLAPTGDKDPFGLRRSVLGCLRILIEANINLDLPKMLNKSFDVYAKQSPDLLESETVEKVYNFMLGRLPVYYTSKGIEHDSVEAVICLKPSFLNDSDKRIKAVNKFRSLSQAESLSEANKRIANILKKAPDFKQTKVNKKLLVEEAEQKLAVQIEESAGKLKPLFEQCNYESSMNVLAELKDPIDEFFDNVMVMDDNIKTRDNRLALLSALRTQFIRIADISKLQS